MNKRCSLVLFLLLIPFSKAKTTPAECIVDHPSFVGGCFESFKDFHSLNKKIQLHYRFYREFNPKKETIVFLNGGPGGTHQQFTTGVLDHLLILYKKYNLVFFDPRGVGQSEKTYNENKEDLQYYNTNANINDIEQLRETILNQKKIILFGHSYGAHLAYGYGILFPNHVSKIIALNGALDELGFLLQASEKQNRISLIFSKFKQEEVQALFDTLSSGLGKDRKGNPISLSDFVAGLISYITTYKGQIEVLPKIIDDYIEINVRKKINTEQKTLAQSSQIILEGIDPIINNYIVCHDLMPQSKINLIQGELEKSLAQQSKDIICKNSLVRYIDSGFDLKPQVQLISAQVLMAGGTVDPLIPIIVQDRDYQLFLKANVSVKYLRMENVGHDPLIENSNLLMNEIKIFLSIQNNSLK